MSGMLWKYTQNFYNMLSHIKFKLKAHSSIVGESVSWYNLVGGQFGNIHQHLKYIFKCVFDPAIYLVIYPKRLIKEVLENVYK